MTDKETIKNQIFLVKKALLKTLNKQAPDNLILSYADFLKHRDYLKCYSFNPKVLDAMLDLNTCMWTSGARMNRLSLLEHTFYFLRKAVHFDPARSWNFYPEINKKLKPETKERIFKVFKMVFENLSFVPFSQTQSVKTICNRMMMNISLSAEAQLWLCEQSFSNSYALNRVLRYPEKSSIISAWVREHYYHPTFRFRRAEQLGWVLNEDPDHTVTEDFLLEDFEFLNEHDKKAIRNYGDELRANKLLMQDFSEFLRPRPGSFDLFDDDDDDFNQPFTSEPELNLSRRFYHMEMKLVEFEGRSFHIPDFTASKIQFLVSIPDILNLTMVWAACYSRLSPAKKLTIYKRYFSPELTGSLLNIAKQTRDAHLLKWLLQHLENR